jgi:sulfur-carrier protein adenylyltransferase/sulfurtransferase
MTELTTQEKIRYDRQIKLPNFGLEKQLRLKNSRVLIVGAGGLGCPIALYLAAAGVGTIGIVDPDNVELSNLHRQIAYRMEDLQHAKSETLLDTIYGINPDLVGLSYNLKLSAENIEEIVSQYDLVIDGTDNFQTRFLVGDTCYFLKVPLLHGAVHQFSAQVILFTNNGPCFRCLYSQPPQQGALAACTEAGILGVVTGTVGTIMAMEAIKYLADLASASLGKLLRYDATTQSVKSLTLNADPDCHVCGDQAKVLTVATSQAGSRTASELASTQQCLNKGETLTEVISTETAKELLSKGASLVDVRETFEYDAGHIDQAISLPMSQIQLLAQDRLKNLAADSQLVVYCKSGKRSLAVLPYLQQLGYKNCYSVEGGIEAWY